ncbi:hypothetical protein Ciccas_003252 [Cichlidogyrus casuarinus]|uniref:Coatomer subunit alpha n=1 Tax=Cichlidogyrus casuarinus TaxID=1844966 RepID=A0ABD2QF34_9PLAT
MSYHLKFDIKSSRVKGLSFHPKRPWLLSSLHSGAIQLWDYKSCTLIDKFEEHEGPVRGLDFHKDQPLFVSGGDDYKIKVWNYKQRKCLFNLTGHLDYIRTTFFHHESPWIISCSDDQTARIWNWQSRTSVSILTGHTHYVMCAQFHPKDDLVVSASLDQTVRVWDISGLRKKNSAPGGHGNSIEDHIRFLTSSSSSSGRFQASAIASAVGNTDLFGSCDVMCKFVMEGHDRGVNWVQFHPSLPVVVSCGDDKTIKIWRMSESRAWETMTLNGHSGNVSCVLFHPRQQDMLLSNGEDRNIFVWDLNKRSHIAQVRRDNDRFWNIVAHPNLNLFASGHDSGAVVFKLELERPAYQTHKDYLLYVKAKQLRKLHFTSAKDIPIMQLRDGRFSAGYLAYNAIENAVLILTRAAAVGSHSFNYDLYALPEADPTGKNVPTAESRSGQCLGAAWVGRNKFVVLESVGNLVVRNLQNEVVKRLEISGVERIFQAGSGNILMADANGVSLFDVINKRVLATVKTVKPVKHIVWSPDNSHVALFSKLYLYVCTKDLAIKTSIHETMRIKSGVWEHNDVFIYTTCNHIKYTLLNGDHGIIRTLDTPVYLTLMKDNQLFCLDRECVAHVMAIDTTEYQFKLALIQRRYEDVLAMVRNSSLVGQAIIAYLEQKGYPEVALQFVRDPRTRFSLAVDCGQLPIALDAAKALDDRACWERLAKPALKQGSYTITETAYQRTKDFDRLAFFYAITGSLEKLRKMMKIAEIRNDSSAHFQNALMLGDVAERVKCLENAGQLSLAYLTAVNHGLTQKAEELADKIVSRNEEGVRDESKLPKANPKARLMMPPTPILYKESGEEVPSCAKDWPLLSIQRDFFETAIMNQRPTATEDRNDPLLVMAGGGKMTMQMDQLEDDTPGWGDEDDIGLTSPNKDDGSEFNDAVDETEEGWDAEGDLELPPEVDVAISASSGDAKKTTEYVAPLPGRPISNTWSEQSNLAGDQVTAGNFALAMRLLHDQVGVVDFSVYEPIFMQLYTASRGSCPSLPHMASFYTYPSRNWSKGSKQLPSVGLQLDDLIQRLQQGYQLTTKGKFNEAVEKFRLILLSIPLLVLENSSQEKEARGLIGVCKEYIVGLSMEITRKGLPKESIQDQVRSAEMACYFTHCRLEIPHLILTLRTAMNLLFKLKNYRSASQMAQRLLDLGPSAEVAAQTRKLMSACDSVAGGGEDAHEMKYDSRNPFELCAATFVPIYRGQECVKDPLSAACYLPSQKGRLCAVTKATQIGMDNLQGLNIVSQRR